MADRAKRELLALIEEGFQKAAWHGPNLRSALRGVRAEEAAWRPGKNRHNIWEIAVHAAYWKYAVTRRIAGSKKREFAEKGGNWFARGEKKMSKAEAQKSWARDLALLAKTHKELRSTIASVRDGALDRPCRSSHQTVRRNLVGIAMHDVYHAGQIQVLRKLYSARKS
ncbi:MAG: DinB family protein [Candidatus Acidiferrales bacterium]